MYNCCILCFEVEEEAAEINESLIFNPLTSAYEDILRNSHNDIEFISTISTRVFEDTVQNGFAIGGVLLAVMVAGGTGLYIRHNRKMEEERKKREERNKGLRGWIHRMMGI
ncbi:MAG: hypothetical protein LBL71_00505 [Endomicrobium sp.]|jgi:uncharacterized iron-regulated membrane protein|nr:hypothetical protein [Endomicrobium sp.]